MATQAAKKTSRLDRSFKADGTGELTPRVHDSVISIVFTTPANGKSVEVPLSSFPAGIQRAAMAYGLNATIGNAMGNLDDSELDDPDEIMGALQERIKSLQAGKWAGERTGGGRPSVVWQAFIAFRTAQKADVSEKRLAELHSKYFDDEANHKALLANAQFASFLASYKAQKAAAKTPAATSQDLLA